MKRLVSFSESSFSQRTVQETSCSTCSWRRGGEGRGGEGRSLAYIHGLSHSADLITYHIGSVHNPIPSKYFTCETKCIFVM